MTQVGPRRDSKLLPLFEVKVDITRSIYPRYPYQSSRAVVKRTPSLVVFRTYTGPITKFGLKKKKEKRRELQGRRRGLV